MFREMAMTRTLAVSVLLLGLAAPALAANVTLPPTGSTTAAAYLTCHQVTQIDMAPIGSQATAECVGIAKNKAGAKAFDNLSVKCMELDETRGGQTNYLGWCSQVDLDGDKFFSTYEGRDGGKVTFIGGTGKYKTMTGGGKWTVTDAPPALVVGHFAFTLDYEVNWEVK
jgi:hypothetical protein